MPRRVDERHSSFCCSVFETPAAFARVGIRLALLAIIENDVGIAEPYRDSSLDFLAVRVCPLAGQGLGQAGFSMIYMSDETNVHFRNQRLFFLCLSCCFLCEINHLTFFLSRNTLCVSLFKSLTKKKLYSAFSSVFASSFLEPNISSSGF